MAEQKIGDPAENHKDTAPTARLHAGWTVDQWVAYVKRWPACTLPGGIAMAIIAHFEARPRSIDIWDN